MLAPVLEATSAGQDALSIYRELGDLRGVVGQLNNLGVNRRFIGDYAGARAWLEESVQTCRQLGDRAAHRLGAQQPRRRPAPAGTFRGGP